jgi:hypothetical protein
MSETMPLSLTANKVDETFLFDGARLRVVLSGGVQQSSEKRQAARDEALRAAANLAFPECVSAHGSSNMARLASRQYGHFHTQ